jgi:transposase-like protein
MNALIDAHLERMAELGQADRRNGCYRRHLLTELGHALELAVPRTRSISALNVVCAYARRAKDVDRMILAGFVLGLSTRKCCDERARARPRSGRVHRQLLSTDPLRQVRRYRGRPALLIADREQPFPSLL